MTFTINRFLSRPDTVQLCSFHDATETPTCQPTECASQCDLSCVNIDSGALIGRLSSSVLAIPFFPRALY